MISIFKKAIALLTIVAIAACMFYCINVSADSTLWNVHSGTPTLTDTQDGYTSIQVDNLNKNVVYTKDKYNFEESTIYIRNIKISSTSGAWGAFTFSSSAISNANKPNEAKGYLPENGFLPVLIRVNPDDTTKFMVFFLNAKGEEQLRSSINRSDNLTIRFVKKETGYALQINEKLFTHDFITKFCNGEFHKDAFVIAQATHLMKGDFKIAKPLWDVTTGTKTSSVYQSGDEEYALVSNSEDSVIYTTSKVNLDTNAIQFKNLALDSNKSFNLNLNFNDALKEEADLSLKVEAANTTYKLYLNNNLLGEISKSQVLKFSLTKKNGNYCLVANDTILDFGTYLNSIFANTREVYVSVAAPKAFSSSIAFTALYWVKVEGSENAVVTLTENNTTHIEVSTNQVVRAPEKYDVFTTGITLSNLDIPVSDSNGKGAYVYFGTTLDSVPSIASANAVTLFVEKTANGVEFSLYKNSNDKKAYIGTVAESNKYDISFSWKHRSRTLKVNDKEFKLDKLTADESKIAATDIETFLGTADKKEVYIALSATDYAKADVQIFYFEKPAQPEGVALYTPTRVFSVNGSDENGYAARRGEESYMVTNLPWDYTVYALETKLNTVSGPIYFALSTTDVSDTNFWATGEGSKINRTGFVITPLENNTKAQISYYAANGEAAETVIAVIDYNWYARHTFNVQKAADSNWYLSIDDEPINHASSTVLNDFMNTNGGDELFFILGSKSGLDVSLFKFKNQPLPPVRVEADGWSATYDAKNFADVVPNSETGEYDFSTKGTFYAYRNGTEDIGKTSVKFKLNTLATGKYIYFAISQNALVSEKVNADNLLPKGDASKVKKVVFCMYPDISNKKLTIKSYNDNFTGAYTEIKVFEDFDFSVAHTFDFRLCTDNNWYLCVDNVVLKDVKLTLLQDYMAKYSSKALYYCIGTSAKANIEGLTIVPQQATDLNIDGVVENDYVVDPNLETWHYYSTKRGALDGNDIDGYKVQRDADTFAYTDLKYDPNTTAISLKITDYGEWGYFALCTSDYTDTKITPTGTGDVVNRVILLLYPESDGNTTLRYWCEDGTSINPTTITAYKFDWSAENHTFDVRKSSDGNWYFCIDGKLIVNKSSRTLNLFMETHAGEDLRYCFGGKGCLGIENAKVVAKPALLNSGEEDLGYEDGDIEEAEDFGFEFDFDNRDEEFEMETQDTAEKEEINPLDYLNKVKVKKRRLVSAAHGIIFTTLEIVGMIAGGVAVLAGATFLAIFLIKKRKKIAIK